jgi:putative ABC transport system permease protein
MEQEVAYGRAAGVIVMTLLGSFAGVALAMAVVGVFGLIAYTVAQRTHEIGIRLALGARRTTVLRMVVRKGIALGAWGVAIGLALAAPLVVLPAGIAPGMPFGQRASVVAGVGVLLWLVALVASYTPARRATRIDPAVALRAE